MHTRTQALLSMALLLLQSKDLINEAMETHIYDADNGEKPDDNCPYQGFINEVDAMLLKDSSKPVYLAYWGYGFAQPGCKIVEPSFFSDDNSYGIEDILAIKSLKVGGRWDSNDHLSHSVYRVGGEVVEMLADVEEGFDLLSIIANMKYDGEEESGSSEPFIMENDDAVSALYEFITSARTIVKPETKADPKQQALDLSLVGENDLLFIEGALSNDESSSDDEMVEFFVTNSIPEAVARAAVQHRDKFMNGIMESGSLKAILEGGEGRDFMLTVKVSGNHRTEPSSNHTEILQHRIQWWVRDVDGVDTPTELDDCSVEHIEKMIKEGYICGELCILGQDGTTEFRGAWAFAHQDWIA